MLTTSLSVSAQLSQCGNARMECNEFVSLSGQCFYPPIRPMPIEIEGRCLDVDRWPTPCSLVALFDRFKGTSCGLTVAT
jgi:hypothetical protein